MKTIETVSAMNRLADDIRGRGERIGFVPTMGFLHEGHISLMREARRRSDVVVASIFVNPTQFGPREDFSRYPRDLARDCAMMETVPVDVLFAPTASEMYRPDAQTWIEVTDLTRGLCGKSRPGHFRGVTTVVAKLFNIVKPHLAFFGEKDFQQLRAIQRMVCDLNMDVEIVPMPIVREADGLAMSSRNAYLSPAERADALALNRALVAARKAYESGVRAPGDLVAAAMRVLAVTPTVAIEYVEAVDAETLDAPASPERPIVLAIATRVGATRLIDNVVLSCPT
ncbi:MAG TPA: pantoate--beta-alanine ligase [Candidatus Binataceae bacterium]|nr:pantoate--beta-alanine ligase [Candidatus Binataceae bacterium]